MIWIFANDRYGRPFVEAARVFARERDTQISIALSTKNLRRPGRVASALVHIRWTLKRLGFLAPLFLDRRTVIRLVPDVNAEAFWMRVTKSDHGVVCGFDQIFSERAIGRFATLVNFHPSLLPRYRGPVPSHWAIAEGEQWSGYTLHEVTPRIDNGPVLFQEPIRIEPGTTESSLDTAIASAGAATLFRWLGRCVDGTRWDTSVVDASDLVRGGTGYQGRP